jgi:hypothetical protein
LILDETLLSFNTVLLLTQRQISFFKLAHTVQDVTREIRAGLRLVHPISALHN